MRKFTRLWLLLMAVTLSAGIMVAQAQKVIVQGAKEKANTEKGIKPSNVYSASEQLNQKALQEKEMSAEQPSVFNFSNAGGVAEDIYGLKKMMVQNPDYQTTWKPGASPSELDFLLEDWTSGSFATNGWTFDPSQAAWSVYTAEGNPLPCARFYWSPSYTNYSYAMVSAAYNTASAATLKLSFDIFLSDYGGSLEQLAVEAFDGTTWQPVANYSNAGGSIAWTSALYDVTAYKNANFQVRFRAYGIDSYNINWWYLDNIRIYEPSATPIVAVSPPSPFTYPVTALGLFNDQVFTVNNAGGGSVTITGFGFAGGSSTDFSITTSTTGTLPPGPVTVTVRFAPTVAGPQTATLEVYDNLADATTSVILNGEGVVAPPNDDCTGATVVAGTFPITVTGTTLGATIDCPGLLDWNAVWYAVTLPYATNDLTVDWCGTADMQTVGVVYYQTCPVVCANYILYTSNVWSQCGTPPGATTAKTTFLGIPGPATIYYPAYSVPQMDHVLTFDVTDPSSCDVPCPVGATPENEPDIADEGVDVTNGGCNMLPGTPLFSPLSIAGQTYCGKANTYLFGGANYRDTDWYRLDLSEETGCFDLTWRAEAEFPVTIIILKDPLQDCSTYTQVGANSGTACTVIDAVALGMEPSIYYFIVLPTNFTGVPASGPHDYVATLIVTPVSCPTTPPNDLCANAIPINCATGTINGTTVNATLDGAPDCIVTNTQPGVWYKFNNPTSQIVTLDLCATAVSFDTKLSVYTGTCASLTCVTGNDDFCGLLSGVTFTATAATDYYVLVHNYGATSGDFTLTITCDPVNPPPANDNCANYQAIPGPYPVLGTPGTTIGATQDCPALLNLASGEVWYSVTLPYALNNLTIVQHGDVNFTSAYIVVTDVLCSCDQADYYFGTYSFVGTDFTLQFAGLAGPATYYYPAATGEFADQGPFTLDVYVDPFYQVSGNVAYAISGTPMDNMLVQISDDSKAYLGEVPTDAAGDYSFYALPGNYNLGGFTYKPAGQFNAGTTVGDIAVAIDHILGTPLTGLLFSAADLDLNLGVDVGDIALMIDNILGTVIPWPAAEWLFENPAFTLSGDVVVDFEAICSGDPDGSYPVPFGSFAPYCTASGFCDEYISNVTVGTINNSSGCSASYDDYTGISTTMNIGVGYPITVTNGLPYASDQCGIWVDWNQNQIFEAGTETMVVTGTPGGGPYTATITPPPGSTLGNTRMRVRIMYTGTLDPCGVTTYGEVEDYTITVAP
jgi:hypothetical protein